MPAPKQVTGPDLHLLISSTFQPIKLFMLGDSRPRRLVTNREALRIIKTGDWEGHRRGQRILFLRQLESKRPWVACMRTANSGVLWPFLEDSKLRSGLVTA